MKKLTTAAITIAGLGFAVFLPIAAAGAGTPTCAQIGSNPAWGLAGNPVLSNLTTTLTPTGSNARCEVNFTLSTRGGPEAGYEPGETQQIRIRVGLPLNAADGGTGGVQGAWNGKTRNLGGGGCAGSVGSVTASTSTGYVGSSTDTGHVGGCEFALQPNPNNLNVGRLTDFIKDSLIWQVRYAKVIAKTYYGMAAVRNYWDGCSTGGRQGMSLAQKYAHELDGWLVGAPAVNYGRFRMAQIWGPVVMKDLLGTNIATAKFNQTNASYIAACDAVDGVTDGIINDPHACQWSATNNICGASGAPATDCLTAAEADVIDKIWDGPRNSKGKKIFPGLPRGASFTALNGANPSATATGQIQWNHEDATYDWRNITIGTYAAEAQLGSTTNGDIINTMDPTLDEVRNGGKKILMWHGTMDNLITTENTLMYYRRVADYFGGIANLQPWFRYFLAPNVGHCGGGSGPAPQGLFDIMVNWVENGVAPDSIVASQNLGGGMTRTRPLCPYPTKAIYNGSGSTDDAANFHCGGDLQTPAALANGTITKYKFETQ